MQFWSPLGGDNPALSLLPITPSSFPLGPAPRITAADHQDFLLVEVGHEALPQPDLLHCIDTVGVAFDQPTR